MSTPSVGEKMINTTLFDLEGKEHELNSFLGKHILIDFWSMTCFPCMNAARELKVIMEKYKNRLHVIGINMDTERALWEQGTKRDGITWANLSDGQGSEGGIGSIYGVFGYPAYMLISPEGIILDKWMGFKPGRFEDKIKEHVL